MFTGIIEEIGVVTNFQEQSAGAHLRVQCKTVLEDAREGSSIAVNGVCLTAIQLQANSFAADLAPETLLRTNLGDLRTGSLVNLERPMLPTSRLSGHIVQGHVDGTGEILSYQLLGNENWWLNIRVPPELDRYLVNKGSVAVDGISLTIATLEDGRMGITIIPHTHEQTCLQSRRAGDRVNIECDILGKHVERLMASRIEATV